MKVLLRRERGDLLFPKPEYDQAITDLSRILIRYSPNSQKITPGRLSASFQGYAASYGLDGPARYAICGRASKKDEIPINYTRLSIAKVCEEQWKWIDEMIDEIRAQMSYIRRFRKLTRDLVTPPRSNGLPDGMRSRLSGFAGSCWVPKVDIFRELIEFVRLRSQRSDLPRHEYINWQMRRLAFESVVLMCFRDFEFDRFRFPGNRTTGVVIVYEAKRKYWESSDHTFGVKFIPAYLHARWWSVVEACAADCSGDGALWCLRDEEFNRIPFSLQKELDYTLSCMGYSTAYIRAYGLRHLGRTMYRDSGMPEWMLNFLMNHYGEGYEKFNPVLGTNFVDYYDRYNRYADIVRDRLGMVE
ncbi:hypothetical protein D6779_09070 [Candidatus Parcubacteria bacterium]|nr:MAG: hypothetical protein D6779_09070 [Candidatus Parcubacteria bacterium]